VIELDEYTSGVEHDICACCLRLLFCCCSIILLVQNILSFYLIETENEEVRISCIVFSGLVWIQLIIIIFSGNKAFNNIEKSRASFKQRQYYKVFLIFSKVLVLARSIIFEAYYPSLIFVSRDRERFFTEFVIAKNYIIPWLDAATFILSLLHLFLIYQTRTFETEFFKAA
jgi:hypothetical protein